MKTLEEYFKTNDGIDHTIRCFIFNNKVSFYIHPANINGDTLDFFVEGNTLIPVLETNTGVQDSENKELKK